MTIKQHDVTTRLYFNDYFNSRGGNNSQRDDSANDDAQRMPSGVRSDLGKPGIINRRGTAGGKSL